MQITQFITQLNNNPENIHFQNTIGLIDEHFDFTPTAFQNGELHNAAGQNSGSCKLFSFAQLHQLTAEQTLVCFGDYYRIDVMQHPAASDHQNIRNFIKFGWDGIRFEGQALTVKNTTTV